MPLEGLRPKAGVFPIYDTSDLQSGRIDKNIVLRKIVMTEHIFLRVGFAERPYVLLGEIVYAIWRNYDSVWAPKSTGLQSPKSSEVPLNLCFDSFLLFVFEIRHVDTGNIFCDQIICFVIFEITIDNGHRDIGVFLDVS